VTTGTAPAAGRPRPWHPRERPHPGLPKKNKERRRAFLRLWGGRCVYCERPLKAERDDPEHAEPMTVEHIVPRIDGGGDNLGNLCPACFNCNSERGSFPLHHDFAERLLERAVAVQAVLVATA
jgi:5-methylcytosine-specific restriction endonuclease McrA